MPDDQWYVVFDSVTGETRSFGTVVADPLPDSLSAAQVTTQEIESVLSGRSEWSAELRCIVPVEYAGRGTGADG